MANLTEEQAQYFDMYERLFLQDGWTLLKQQMQSEIDALNEQIKYSLPPEQIPVARARRNFAEEIVRLEEFVEQQKQLVLSEDSENGDDDSDE